MLLSALLRTFNFSPADSSEEELFMQKKLWTAAVIIAVVIALALPLANFATPADEQHPVIREAIDKLQDVRSLLVNDADRDFHGHRANAVKHVDAALSELHQALESDRDHGHDHDQH
jgi:anti-sigma-K factor RskA